jgi:alpha-galactosidase
MKELPKTAAEGGRAPMIFLRSLAIFLCGAVSPVFAETVSVSALDLGHLQHVRYNWNREPRPDVSAEGRPLKIAGREFAHGFGVRGAGRLCLELDGQATRLRAQVGVSDDSDETGPVWFEVIGDGRRLTTTPLIERGQAAAEIDVALTGVRQLVLAMVCDGVTPLGAWVEPTIEYAGAPPVTIAPPKEQPYMLTPPSPAEPRINGPRVFGARPNHPFLFSIPATGERPMTFSAEGLPQGLALDAGTGRITGRVAVPGTYRITLHAKNARGKATQALRIEIGERIALTPPMGWNSWPAWGVKIDQKKIRAAAHGLVEHGLDQHGYSYVNIDDAWQGVRGGKFNAIQPNEKFAGLAGLCDEVHALGLKIGIYSTPWTTSYAGYVGGSAENPQGAWTRPKGKRKLDGHTLPWAVGKYSFAWNDAQQWAEWGIDYLKYDWNPNSVAETAEMASALRISGRDIVLSLSNTVPPEAKPQIAHLAQSWRTGQDIVDSWSSAIGNGLRENGLESLAGPGHWNDPDTFVIGMVSWGRAQRADRLTPDEQYSQVSLWSLLAAPFLFGSDLAQLDDFTKSLLTNDEVIAVDQDELGRQGHRVSKQRGAEVWARPLADGSIAVGLFNRDELPAAVTVRWSELKLEGGSRLVRDLWRQRDLGEFAEAFSATVPRHGVVLVKVGAVK